LVREWEQDFRRWGRPPSQTEIDRCNNAVSVVRNAVHSYVAFAARNIEVFAQGSYRSGTNVRVDSDVDICVRCMDVCFSKLGDGVSDADTGLVSASYTYAEFKDDVEQALRTYLGEAAVVRGNKAIDLHANTYRVDAGVVPTFEHRRYYRDSQGLVKYLSGTELRPDKGGRIINWPEQNYRNGTEKNNDTLMRYKKMVRILKTLKNEMADAGIAAADPIPSFLIECLVWNVPNSNFGNTNYTDDVRNVLLYLYSTTRSKDSCHEWGEINELKYLFRDFQTWRQEQAYTLIVSAWGYSDMEQS